MIAALIGVGATAWVGGALLLGSTTWANPPRWETRVGPYLPGEPRRRATLPPLTWALGPLIDLIDRAGTAVGFGRDLPSRLERIHSPLSPEEARLRQLGAAGLALVGTTVVGAIVLPVSLQACAIVAAPIVAMAAVDHQLTRASDRWRQEVLDELPVVAEHLAMLLSAGYSLGGALDRTAERASGACGQDLRRVTLRIRQGMAEHEALREWAQVADVVAVDNLVTTLELSRHTGDVAQLVSAETDAIRLEAERQLVADIQRRAQLVWVPVALASLIPGSIFIGIPFVQALHAFAGS